MKMSQKLIALVVVVAMAIGVMGIGVVAFSDVPAGTVTHEATVTLNALQIMGGYPNGTFQPEGNITRAEFAAVVTRMRDFGNIIPAGANTGFSDVPSSHWASGYIAMAVDMDVVRGMGDGTFAPEAPVTFAQAVAMVMRAIGYQPMANAQGGFPVGYMVAAVSAGVTANVGQVAQDQPANRGVVARLAYAALDAPMMQRWVWGTTVEYRIMDGTNLTTRITLLNSVFDVVKLRGQIVANPVTTLEDTVMLPIASSVLPQMVTVRIMTGFDAGSVNDALIGQNAQFRLGTSNAAALIGQQVIVYARDMRDGQNRIVLSAAPEAGRNQYVEFSIDLFDGFDADAAIAGQRAGVIRYQASADARNLSSVNIAENFTVIYNGRFRAWGEVFDGEDGNSEIAGMPWANGTIRVLNSNGDGGHDVIFVNTPQVAVVDEVSTTARTITDRTGNFSTISLARENRVAYNITRGGESISLGDLRPWDVLMVEYNPTHSDDGYYNIRVITDVRRNATIRERGNTERSEDGWIYTIGNETFLAALGAYGLPSDGFRLGTRGDFFIDEFGNIAAFLRDVDTVSNYGFVFAADQEFGFGGRGERGVLRLMHADGRVSNRRFANVVTVIGADGYQSTFRGDGSYPDQNWGTAFGDGDIADLFEDGMLIRFDVNTAGEINMVQRATTNGDPEVDFVMTGAGTYTFEARNDRLSREADLPGWPTIGRSSLNVGADTIVFWIATDANGYFDTLESDVRTRNAFVDAVEYETVFAFGETSAGNAQVLVVIGHNAVVTPGALAVYVSHTFARNAENDTIANVTFMQGGELRTVSTTPSAMDAFLEDEIGFDFNRGDAFRFSTNARGQIDAATWLVAFGGLEEFSRENGNGTLPGRTIDPAGVGIVTGFTGGVDELSSWTIDLPGPETTITFGPAYSRSSNRVFVGPETVSTYEDWRIATDSFNVPSTANVYVLDMALSGAAQLRAGAVGNIANPSSVWATTDMRVTRGPGEDAVFFAPVLEARDWVLIQEHDNRITDVIVIRSANYVLGRV